METRPHLRRKDLLQCNESISLITSLIAVTSAWAVGSVFFKTMLWQLTTTSSLRTTTAPKGPPSPHSTPLYASSTAFVMNAWSLSFTAAQYPKQLKHQQKQLVLSKAIIVRMTHINLDGKEENLSVWNYQNPNFSTKSDFFFFFFGRKKSELNASY